MEASKFTEKIYGPYGEAWKIIKLLALAEDNNPQLQEVLSNYMSEVDKFSEKYADNDFAQLLRNRSFLITWLLFADAIPCG